MLARSVPGEEHVSKIAKTVDPRVLKDDELHAVAGGETNSFQTVSKLLEVRYDSSKVAVAIAR
jgi:hypothetical protein